ncbi:ubiquitin carboxyl-terminal hydrolase 2 [Canna indica]|uniref:Ubiquitin carboxyl-terminal hydrolase 2 n=1 Tax=Canna indica TaxID=4628 RepID=A0AAQ3JS16_9LILI|nr:ubiquitin carboxyl-terminal hydrolase 2 [Canna indica]
MGKKMKSKGRNPRKVHPRASPGSAQPGPGTNDLKEDVEVEDGEQCSHYSKDSAEVNRVLSGILSSRVSAACEHCRDEPSARKSGGKKGRQQKKREGGGKSAEAGSESNFIWVCLNCNRCFCGGAVSDSVPYGHARRHSKQDHHDLMVRLDNPSIGWCFSCNLAIPVELPHAVADVREVKSITSDKRVEGGLVEPLTLEDGKGYMIRGLSNLGNTCFFNSVMQNLLAIDMLREYMVNLDRPIGPLTMALKKLFNETSGGANNKGVLSPKNLFGSICSKSPQFRGYQQQDSHELLRCLLDGLYLEERSTGKSQDSSNGQAAPSSKTTVVDDIFGGELSSTVRCVECGHTSTVCEPFLDLSLPVPSKKTAPKKAAPPPPKRSKPPLKERNKSQRFREKGSARGSVVMEQYGQGERVNTSVEFSESSSPASRPEENRTCDTVAQTIEANIALEAEDSSWMDYLAEPIVMTDALILGSQSCGDLNSHCVDSGQVVDGENNISVKSEIDNSPMELMVSPNYSGENSTKNATSSSCIHDSGVTSHPCEALDNTNLTVATSETLDNMSSSENMVKEPCALITAVVDSEIADGDFDGFGDLFNEPEVTSELKKDTSMVEEMAVTLWANNSSETSQEEVDNSNALVSIESCLASFTNTELLSDEHAWYCEQCSEVSSSGMMTADKTCKSETLTTPEYSNTRKLQVNGDQDTIEKNSSSFKVDCLSSTGFKALHNGELASDREETEKPDSDHKSLNIIFEPEETGCKNGEITTGNNTILSDSKLCDQTDKPNIMIEVQECADSGPEQIKDNETTSSKEDVQTSGQDQAASLTSSPHDTGENLSNSCENDNRAVNHAFKKGPKLSSQAHPVQGRRVKKEEPEKRKVKRDATKRILINRTPPILTIHLKRFSQDTRGRLSKMRGHVRFHETLDLTPYLDPRSEEKEKISYRLFGVVEHSGGMSGGHYVAYVRGERNNKKALKDINSTSWFYASDAHVREVSLSEVLRCEAYILFYEKM